MTGPRERWRGFTDKVLARLDELIAEAGVGVLAIGRAYPNDALPLGNAITGLDHRVRQLQQRIEQVWDAEVRDRFDAVDDPWGADHKQDAERACEERWQLAKAGWLSTLAREAEQRARTALERPQGCVRCAAPLPLSSRRHTASVPCPACGSVNQVVAPPEVTAWFGMGVQSLADAAALPHRHAVERYRMEVERSSRGRSGAEDLASLTRWAELERAVWETLARVRAELTGDPVDREFVESRMRQFTKFELESRQVWVRANGRIS